jgi:hypothetical protein
VGVLPTGGITSCYGQTSESDVVHDHVRLRQNQIVAVARVGVGIGTRYMQDAGTTERGKAVGGPSCSGELSSGGGSTEMISDGRPDAKCKVLIKCVGEHLLPTAQSRRLCRPGSPVAAPGTGRRHIDPFGHLIPGRALVA